jgi:hypothetical protein
MALKQILVEYQISQRSKKRGYQKYEQTIIYLLDSCEIN